MKKLFIVLLTIAIATGSQAQTVAEDIAGRIAKKMKDSLSLNETQRQQVYDINMRLTSQKQAARAASTDRDIVGKELQRIENTRDGLYQPVLGEEKYLLYKQKKKALVSAD